MPWVAAAGVRPAARRSGCASIDGRQQPVRDRGKDCVGGVFLCVRQPLGREMVTSLPTSTPTSSSDMCVLAIALKNFTLIVLGQRALS
jgi:hypothetical protein